MSTPHILSSDSYTIAVTEEEWQPGQTIDLQSGTAFYCGLPEKDVSVTVASRFENNEIGSGGVFLTIPRTLYTSEEIALAQQRGTFQIPQQEDKSVPQLPWESNIAGGDSEGFVRAFVVSDNVSPETIARVGDDFRRGVVTDGGSERAFQLVIEPHDVAKRGWKAIDYALLVGREFLDNPERKVCLEAFLLIDGRTAEDGTVDVVYQLTQIPVRRDPIRIARYSVQTIGMVLPATVTGSWKFVDAFKDDPTQPIILD
ncbi:hypothetical protein PLICRDRAFT_93806 [Plicaturopsis crispa FD-325 SS-3]|nr:hypothetical protein PLICRDRAFT_93806 [Plicaturopsis crispa FD-325 SS-3]